MSSTKAFWRLDGKETTLLVIEDHGVPRLYWYGRKLRGETTLQQLLAHDDTALAFGGMDAVTPLSLFPQASTGYTGSPALNGHRNGAAFAHAMRTRSVVQNDNTLTIELQDDQAGLAVELSLSLDEHSDVASMRTTLKNIADTPYTVDWLASATLPLPGSYRQCLSQHGRWGLENQTHRRHIAPGRIDISNLHGRTSHEHAPALICGTDGFGVNGGDITFAQLAWSGNFSLRVERLSNGVISLQAGVLHLPGEVILQAGEQLSTPSVSFTRGKGMNSCTQRFHRYIRSSILPEWTRRTRPIHANSWEALYFNHDLEALFPLIDAAASVGAERFVLDDGWFRHRRADNAGLGDWYVDESIYPDGLHPVVSHVRKHGLQFGLWFEPEMVNPDSDLYREHPEWALQLSQVETPLARNQLVLDISRDDVADYLFERITSLVHEYAIDYIKWDMNRDLVLAGDGSHARAAAQPVALYRLLERILAVCPNLEIESCASGGARADLGILQHTGRVWTSDNIDPIERAGIQQGFLRFMPPEIMGAHVGHKTAHLTGRVTSLHTRAIVALQGQFGFELDARKLDPQDIITLQHYTRLYKSNRQWMANSVYWQLPTYSKSLTACGFVDSDQQQALYSVVAIGNMHPTRPGHLPLSGLDPNALYTLTLESINLTELAPFNKIFPEWCQAAVTSSGELLMTLGVPLPVLPPQSALLIGCHRDSR
ncbi:alpha-galactosidase [Granulosicoccus sp. 3-233]|uniref:alpha-galactosidase n=1 Tax=Granulosicoccus sp. 3-233 TaxID=3417969 RepID=UPI003D333B12